MTDARQTCASALSNRMSEAQDWPILGLLAIFALGEKRMRFLVKVSFPVEAGNAAAKKDGFKVIQTILEQQKPEAAYFIAEGGRRTGVLILNMNDASELARIAEPWFL